MTTEKFDKVSDLAAAVELRRSEVRTAIEEGDAAALAGKNEEMLAAIERASVASEAWDAAIVAYYAQVRAEYAQMGFNRKRRRALGNRSRVTPR